LELREFAAVLERCKLLIHHDSSPLHLAGALGVPVVAIFGYQNPRHWGPLIGSGRVVRLDLPCSPCDQDFLCDRSFECVRQLPVSQVLKEVEAQLELISTPPA
jgi:ADP-heptose:LPS heptosyltransferase